MLMDSVLEALGKTPLIRLTSMSSGNVFAALHMDNGHNKVVTLLPDRAERYFSTALL